MRHTPIKLGPLALLLSVICICLTTLALLNYSTARADKRLAEKFAETVGTRYALESEGQELLAALDGAMPAQGWETDGAGNAWRVLERDGFQLRIGLAPDGAGGYTIINWTQEHEWEADTSLDNLWPGF